MKIKRLIAIVLSCMLCLVSLPAMFTVNAVSEETESVIWDGTADSFWYNDTDIEIHISTAEELAGFANLVNSGNDFEGKIIYLENSLYLNDISSVENWGETPPENFWVPIGNGSETENNFKGIFDGKGNNIYGIYTSGYKWGGLFGCATNNSIIRNLNIKEGYISGSSYVGGVVAFASEGVKIINCSNRSNIYSNGTGNFIGAGGITGIGGIIKKCKNYGLISSYAGFDKYKIAESWAGGISGGACVMIFECCNFGNVKADVTTLNILNPKNRLAIAGGIAGCYYNTAKIENCYNFGAVQSYTASGGICGQCGISTIDSCYNVGCVESSVYIGGILGSSNDTTIINSYYINSIATSAIGNIEDIIISPNKSTMQGENFAKTLGKAFVYVEGDFPKLLWEVNGYIIGDINNDWEINVADLVMLQKWLVCSGELNNWKAGDLCKDEKIDIFDLVMMRRLLVSSI